MIGAIFKQLKQVELRPLCGPQYGLVRLVKDAVDVGTKPGSSARLIGGENEAAQFEIIPGVFSFAVRNKAGSILVNGARCSKNMQVWDLRKKETNLTLDGIELSVTRPPLSLAVVQRGMLLALVAVTFLLILLVLPAATQGSLPSVLAYGGSKPAQAAAVQPVVKPPVLAAAPAMELLEAGLIDFGLKGSVTIEEAITNLIALSGDLQPDEFQRYRNFLRWYDQQPGLPTYENRVKKTEQAAVDFPGVSMVQIYPEPRVYLLDKTSFSIGETSLQGWEFLQISLASVRVQRDGQVMTIVLSENESL